MRLRSRDEPYVAVDAGTRVPARVGILRVVDTHGQNVVAVFVQIGCHVIEERDVAVGTLTKQMAVQIDFRAIVDALEVDEEGFILHLSTFILHPSSFIQHEVFAIPADAAGQITGAGSQLWRHDTLY